MYKEEQIKEYLKELASRNPTPGGGSASALAAAIGAALISKVANFTTGKEKYKDAEPEMKRILESAENIRLRLEKLCTEDALCYGKLSDAYKSPRTDLRGSKIQIALKDAMEVPRDICRSARDAMGLCETLALKGNPNLITDVGDASLLLKGAFRAAFLNVEINLKYIEDRHLTNRVLDELEPMKREVADINKNVMEKVERSIR